jgi:hypothetical protein
VTPTQVLCKLFLIKELIEVILKGKNSFDLRYFAHLLHFFGTQYHAALFAHGKSYKDHLLVATAFEFVLYPLDTLRTLVQTDLANNFNGYRGIHNFFLYKFYKIVWLKLWKKED